MRKKITFLTLWYTHACVCTTDKKCHFFRASQKTYENLKKSHLRDIFDIENIFLNWFTAIRLIFAFHVLRSNSSQKFLTWQRGKSFNRKILNSHLLVQSQQWKWKKNVWNLFKVNYKRNRTTSLTSDVSIGNFEQVNASWKLATKIDANISK